MTKLEMVNILMDNNVTTKREVKNLEQYLLNKYTKRELEALIEYLNGDTRKVILKSEIKDIHDTNILYSDLLDTYRDDSETKNWSYDRIYKEELNILTWAYEDDGITVIDDSNLKIEPIKKQVDSELENMDAELIEIIVKNAVVNNNEYYKKRLEIIKEDLKLKNAIEDIEDIYKTMEKHGINERLKIRLQYAVRTFLILIGKAKKYTTTEIEAVIEKSNTHKKGYLDKHNYYMIFLNIKLTLNKEIKEKVNDLYDLSRYYHGSTDKLLSETIEYETIIRELHSLMVVNETPELESVEDNRKGGYKMLDIVRLRNGKHYLNDKNILVGITDGEIIGKDFYDSNNQHEYFKDLDIMEVVEMITLTDVRLSTEDDMAKTIKSNGVAYTNIESDKELNTNSKYITIAIPSIERTGKDVDVRLINDTVYKFYNRPSTVRLESAQGYWKGSKEDITLVTYYNNDKLDITPADIFQLKESFNQEAVSVWLHDNIDLLEQLIII